MEKRITPIVWKFWTPATADDFPCLSCGELATVMVSLYDELTIPCCRNCAGNKSPQELIWANGR